MWKTAFVLAIALTGVAAAAPAAEWLSLCGKCLSPVVFAKSGIDTANAVAQARITREAASDWCENWEPQTPRASCIRLQMSSDDARKVHRATANCQAGRITPTDGKTYSLAGYWTSDVGRGRSRWRDGAGRIVGQDHASNGLAIAQQWELLCPSRALASAGSASKASPSKAPPSKATATGPGSTGLKPAFNVGQTIEARYGREWVRGRVTAIREERGRNGPRLAYDVQLENGRRGIVPDTMLRAPQ